MMNIAGELFFRGTSGKTCKVGVHITFQQDSEGIPFRAEVEFIDIDDKIDMHDCVTHAAAEVYARYLPSSVKPDAISWLYEDNNARKWRIHMKNENGRFSEDRWELV
jgi:hypothetical protein